MFFDVRGHRYNMPATAQKARQLYDELMTKDDGSIACEALLGHRVDDRVERVRDLQVVGQVRSVQVAEDDQLPCSWSPASRCLDKNVVTTTYESSMQSLVLDRVRAESGSCASSPDVDPPILIWRHLNETEFWKFDFGLSVRDKWPLASALVSKLVTRARVTCYPLLTRGPSQFTYVN